jgi:type I restriction enzyme R subunit
MTESHTRAAVIDVQLAQAGWAADASAVDFETEYEVGSRGEPDHGYADYVLPDSAGNPLAVVEAKRTSRDVRAGQYQAADYAGAIEARFGKRPFIFLANGDEIFFWDEISNPRPVAGFFTQVDLDRRRFQRDNRTSLSIDLVDETITERPYQLEIIGQLFDHFEANHRKGLVVAATGTGKTRIATSVVKALMEAGWVQRVLFLTDRDALATQALLDGFQQFLPAEPSERIWTSTYDPTRRLYVATLQTMQDFHTEISPGAFDLVISDECHRSIYNRWQVVLSYFDALLVGLTATPSDFIDRNTYTFFGCRDQRATAEYPYERAVQEGWLVPFEVYHARTHFQVTGIHGDQLPEETRRELERQGIDPDSLHIEGTDIEKRVLNPDTTDEMVQEFFENCLVEPDGNLPGKSIVFAINHAHARRLVESFERLYPQYPGLAMVIDSHQEHPDRLLKRFKTENLPRIAISVDMLDTGVDIPTAVNLGFFKPVFSRTKFWQMIGRGTRLVDDHAAKPWCPAGTKTRFRILDFWQNFERFQLDPDGVTPSTSTPVGVRLFRTLIAGVRAARAAGRDDVATAFTTEVRQMIGRLPLDAAGVRENRRAIEEVEREAYWVTMPPAKWLHLEHTIAPLVRHLPIDVAETAFSIRCLDFVIAELRGDADSAEQRAEAVRNDLLRLPVDHPDIRPVDTMVRASYSDGFATALTVEDALTIRDELAEFMALRLREPSNVITLDLDDMIEEQRQWIPVGPDGQHRQRAAYRDQVETWLKAQTPDLPPLERLAAGVKPGPDDLHELRTAIYVDDVWITEDSLRGAYQAPHGTLTSLLRHALGVELLPTRSDAIRDAFDAVIAARAIIDQDQANFVRLFARRLAASDRIDREQLFAEPFTRIAPDPEVLFSSEDVDDLLSLAAAFELTAPTQEGNDNA